MKSKAIAHQFEFWTHLGETVKIFSRDGGYSIISAKDFSWPSRIFDLAQPNVELLKQTIECNEMPHSIALEDGDIAEHALKNNGFQLKSVVDGMTLEIKPSQSFSASKNIDRVRNEEEIKVFAEIASEAFGYTIYWTTLVSLTDDSRVQLLLGRYNEDYVSCGMLFQDTNGDAGLHMIGLRKNFRGFGLGKEMTSHLLYQANKSRSISVHLVASKLGAPIYRKLGFLPQGHLNSYSI